MFLSSVLDSIVKEGVGHDWKAETNIQLSCQSLPLGTAMSFGVVDKAMSFCSYRVASEVELHPMFLNDSPFVLKHIGYD
jgi:hypothetical protein